MKDKYVIDSDAAPFLHALDEFACISKTDAAGNIVYVNDKFLEISKFERGELIGRNHRIFKSGQHSQEFYKDLWNTISNGRTWRGEAKNKAKDGSIFWLDTTIVPIIGANGKPESYIALRFPITDKKNVEQYQQLLATVVKSINTAIFVTDLELNVTLWNAGAERMFGFTSAEAVGKNSSALLRSKLSAEKRVEFVSKLLAGNSVSTETIYMHKDDSLVEVFIHVSPIMNEHGNVSSLSIIAIDMTAHNLTEKLKLLNAQSDFNEIFLRSNDIIFTISPEGVMTSLNPALTQLTGWSVDESVGKAFGPLIYTEDLTYAHSVFSKILSGEKVDQVELRLQKKGGGFLWVETTFTPIFEDKKLVKVFGISRDTTYRRALADASRKEELLKSKENFMFRVIHDLRAPTHAIQLLVQELSSKKDPLMNEVTELLDLANSRMRKLIDDLMLIASGEKSELSLVTEAVDIGLIIKGVYRELGPAAEEMNVTLQNTVPEKPIAIAGDKAALAEVFTNIIDNAIKYNVRGGVVNIDMSHDGSTCRIKVHNSGKTVSAEDIPKLFNAFYRADVHPDVFGTGLGLFIVKGLVEKMGGSISVDSKIGEGTTFTVSFPVATAK